MKCIFLFLSFFVVLASGDVYAQESMMSGIVLDEQNKLVPEALLKMTRRKEANEVRVGDDGMYYSKLLPVGYYIVDIYLRGRRYTAKEVHLARTKEETVYYNFRLRSDNVAVLYTDTFDPLLRLRAGERVPQSGN